MTAVREVMTAQLVTVEPATSVAAAVTVMGMQGVGAVLAMEKGRNGERYILAGENITVKQLFDLMAELTGLKAPALKLPVPVIRTLAAVLELASKLTGARPMLDRSQVDEFAGKYAYFDNTKAERELGYTYLPARETVRRTISWIVERGFVTERRQRALRLHPSLAGSQTSPGG